MDSSLGSRRPFSIKLWPPSQNTRYMLVDRITNNLTSSSIFTQKYGCLTEEDAEENGRRIEDNAFRTADQHYEREPDGDGGSAVQLYAKECSRLMLEVLKRGSGAKEDKKEDSTTENDDEKRDLTIENDDEKKDLTIENDDIKELTTKTDDKMEELTTENDAVIDETFFDISKGQRAFIEPEEAEDILKPLKEPGNPFTKICFSNRSFGLGAARVAEPILVSLKDQLKEVDLSDFIAGRPESEALEVMTIFSDALEGSILKYLNLSNNALGEKGVRAFGSLLKSQPCLEELYLINDGISEEAARAVCELLPSTEKLKVLQFHNNMTGDEGARAISEVVKNSSSLEDFRCSSTRIGSEGGVALSEALETCTHLKKLDLRDNMFGLEAGVAISKALSKYTNLTEVYLSYLNLEDEGTISIANALKEAAPELEVLEMAGNDITSEAAPILAACIAAKKCLTKLNLAENELKDEGTIQIAKALENHEELKEVDMSNNYIRRAGARALAQTVVVKQNFKLLVINENIISDEGIDDVKQMFKKCPEMLGSLEDNDPEGGDAEEETGDDVNDGSDDELTSKLQNLEVSQQD